MKTTEQLQSEYAARRAVNDAGYTGTTTDERGVTYAERYFIIAHAGRSRRTGTMRHLAHGSVVVAVDPIKWQAWAEGARARNAAQGFRFTATMPRVGSVSACNTLCSLRVGVVTDLTDTALVNCKNCAPRQS